MLFKQLLSLVTLTVVTALTDNYHFYHDPEDFRVRINMLEFGDKTYVNLAKINPKTTYTNADRFRGELNPEDQQLLTQVLTMLGLDSSLLTEKLSDYYLG
jgi:hypothetical protein